ncbi:MAG: hypothetical protein FJ060_03195 [Cyanobacteria bacterium K_Offshore_0m_m2_072]|nr:hypothetical protein [Cyanobacteria bacterium K_Offshore_0m_m2_072]
MAIDGSGSMLGLTGSRDASSSWKALLQAVSLAAASSGTTVEASRIGSNATTRIANPLEAASPCFFGECGSHGSVSSSLDVLWSKPTAGKNRIPLHLAISDLEVNNGDIAKLVAAIQNHVKHGATVAILAIKVPFQGRVFNSEGQVIYTGLTQRPIYLLATGPRNQLHTLMTDIRAKAALGGVPTTSMQLTFLEDQANTPTLLARSVKGVPTNSISSGLPVQLGGAVYGPGQNEYMLAKLSQRTNAVILSSRRAGAIGGAPLPDMAIAQLESLPVAGQVSSLAPGIAVQSFQLGNQEIALTITIPQDAPSTALRASVPRGQLPEAWWVSWNRQNATAAKAREQTDGLLLLLTSLSKLLVAPGTTPAAALCLAFNHGQHTLNP